MQAPGGWPAGPGAILAHMDKAYSRSRYSVLTGAYSWPLALHSPSHWVMSVHILLYQESLGKTYCSPQKARGPDQVHGHMFAVIRGL